MRVNLVFVRLWNLYTQAFSGGLIHFISVRTSDHASELDNVLSDGFSLEFEFQRADLFRICVD